jgi:hypothetical protein
VGERGSWRRAPDGSWVFRVQDGVAGDVLVGNAPSWAQAGRLVLIRLGEWGPVMREEWGIR